MRITKDIRRAVLNAVIKKLIAPQIQDVMDQFHTMAERTMRNIYSKKVQEWIQQMPEGGLQLTSSIELKFSSGDRIRHDMLVRRSGIRNLYGDVNVTLKRPVRVLAVDRYKSEWCISKSDDARATSLLNQLTIIEQKQKELEKTVSAAMLAVNTRKQLEINYPDLVQYLPVAEVKNKQLAITSDDVTRVLVNSAAA